MTSTSENQHCYLKERSQLLAGVTLQNGLHILIISSKSSASSYSIGMVANVNLWHQRLAQVPENRNQAMIRNKFLDGITLDTNQSCLNGLIVSVGRTLENRFLSRTGSVPTMLYALSIRMFVVYSECSYSDVRGIFCRL